MICDRCLLYLEREITRKARKLLYAYGNIQGEPSIKILVARSGLSQYHVREALMTLRGAGLVWGDYFYSLSPSGQRLIELLATADRPEPAEALCDNCLMEIADLLPNEAYDVLALLTRHYQTTQQFVSSLGVSSYKLREIAFLLKGAQLVKVNRGRIYRLTTTGRRLGSMLQYQATQPAMAM